MPSIYLTEEHERFRETVRRVMEDEVAPRVAEWERARRIPRDVWRRLGELGLLGVHVPAEYGGAGADLFYSVVLLEELARSGSGGFGAAVSVQSYIATGALVRRGSEALKRRYVAGSVAGALVGALAISEPDTGSDVQAIRTTAVRDGSGVEASYVINGTKVWITNGVYGDFAVVACRTAPRDPDPDAEPAPPARSGRGAGAHGISLLVVDLDAPGVSRRALDKLGWHSSDTAELTFDGVRVPAANLVGGEHEGFGAIMETFALERLVTAAGAVGSAALALETTLAYMAERSAFGRPLTRFQALRHRLADLAAELEAVRQLVYHVAWLAGRGHAAVTEAAMAKLLATELAKRTVDECLQFHGAAGYMEEFPLARAYRDVRALPIVAGTSEIMREIIARAVIDGDGAR